jgi:hypothetical protein
MICPAQGVPLSSFPARETMLEIHRCLSSVNSCWIRTVRIAPDIGHAEFEDSEHLLPNYAFHKVVS